ncbi:hypothetical protein BD413DRAFT_539196 [Trametes elegans]|nr:hypothetical protein BD413DRAFT_539196 [Trametes elegans]
MFGLAVLSVALLAGQAAASAIAARSPLAHLLAIRQTSFDPSTIPAQCKSECSAISQALTSNTCSTDIDCICSSSASNGLYNCLECILAINPDASDLAQAQGSFDQYASACASGNVNVADRSLTLPSGSGATSAGGQVTVSDFPSPSVTRGHASATATGGSKATQDPSESSDEEGPIETGSSSSSGGATRNNAGMVVSASSIGIACAVGVMMVALAL